jgi:hypothetical protein
MKTETTDQLNAIDIFFQKKNKINVRISKVPVLGEEILSIRIGNNFQLGTLLSRIVQKSLIYIPNLMEYVRDYDLSTHEYLVLSSKD